MDLDFSVYFLIKESLSTSCPLFRSRRFCSPLIAGWGMERFSCSAFVSGQEHPPRLDLGRSRTPPPGEKPSAVCLCSGAEGFFLCPNRKDFHLPFMPEGSLPSLCGVRSLLSSEIGETHVGGALFLSLCGCCFLHQGLIQQEVSSHLPTNLNLSSEDLERREDKSLEARALSPCICGSKDSVSKPGQHWQLEDVRH